MKCQACQGLMVVDHFFPVEDDQGQLWLRAWRCRTCRAVVEPGLSRRRQAEPSSLPRLVSRWMGKPLSRYEVVPLGT